MIAPPAGLDADELIDLMGRDKKALDGLTFVLDGADGVEVVDDVDADAPRCRTDPPRTARDMTVAPAFDRAACRRSTTPRGSTRSVARCGERRATRSCQRLDRRALADRVHRLERLGGRHGRRPGARHRRSLRRPRRGRDGGSGRWSIAETIAGRGSHDRLVEASRRRRGRPRPVPRASFGVAGARRRDRDACPRVARQGARAASRTTPRWHGSRPPRRPPTPRSPRWSRCCSRRSTDR